MTKPLKSAWLLTWEWIGENKRPPCGEKVLALLSGRWSPVRVSELVEQFYVALTSDPAGKLSIARNRTANPYPIMYGNVGGIPVADQMHVGHNPWIGARRVRNVRLATVNGQDQLVWDEVPLPEPPDIFK